MSQGRTSDFASAAGGELDADRTDGLETGHLRDAESLGPLAAQKGQGDGQADDGQDGQLVVGATFVEDDRLLSMNSLSA